MGAGRGIRGPNLQGRTGGQGRTGPPGTRKPRPDKAKGKAALARKKAIEERKLKRQQEENETLENKISDGMAQHLLRLQRKEWDKVPYEPKYTKGSKALEDIIATGKTLFNGQVPRVKETSRLDKVLGIAGRHGV